MALTPPPRTADTGEARVSNALLRCRRDDDKAAPLFDSIGEVPGLWVLELGPGHNNSWSRWFAETESLLSPNRMLLENLRHGSDDYTLHITVAFSNTQPLVLPLSLLELLASCGIAIELYDKLGDDD